MLLLLMSAAAGRTFIDPVDLNPCLGGIPVDSPAIPAAGGASPPPLEPLSTNGKRKYKDSDEYRTKQKNAAAARRKKQRALLDILKKNAISEAEDLGARLAAAGGGAGHQQQQHHPNLSKRRSPASSSTGSTKGRGSAPCS